MRKSQQQAAQNALKKKIENTTEEKSDESGEESEDESSDADSDSDAKQEEEDARAGVGGIADDSDLFTLKKSDHDVIASDSSEVGSAHVCAQAHPVCSIISK